MHFILLNIQPKMEVYHFQRRFLVAVIPQRAVCQFWFQSVLAVGSENVVCRSLQYFC